MGRGRIVPIGGLLLFGLAAGGVAFADPQEPPSGVGPDPQGPLVTTQVLYGAGAVSAAPPPAPGVPLPASAVPPPAPGVPLPPPTVTIVQRPVAAPETPGVVAPVEPPVAPVVQAPPIVLAAPVVVPAPLVVIQAPPIVVVAPPVETLPPIVISPPVATVPPVVPAPPVEPEPPVDPCASVADLRSDASQLAMTSGELARSARLEARLRPLAALIEQEAREIQALIDRLPCGEDR